jgi:transcriptional regulator with XRE-family HTH domain
MTNGVIVSADALRGYVRTLRKGRGVSQGKLADAIKMALRTYKDWELGTTISIDAPYLIRAVQYLNGSLEQVASLPDTATNEDGARIAQQWLTRDAVVAEFAPRSDETPEEARALSRLLDLLEAGVPPDEAARRVRSGQ